MAHVISFTRLLGGIATSPASEIPFAGSFFDVQAGTWRAPDIGMPTISVVVSPFGGATERRVGHPSVYRGVCVDFFSAVGEAVSPGTPSVLTGVSVVPAGGRREAQAAPMTVSVTALVVPDGAESGFAGGFPRLSFPWSINPIGVDSFVVHGEHRFDSGVSLNVAGAARDFATGEIFVSSGVDCLLAGMACDILYGEVDVSWRKCVRWELCAEVRLRDEKYVCIRPSPPQVRQVQTMVCLRRKYEMKVELARRLEIASVARKNNAFLAKVSREELL